MTGSEVKQYIAERPPESYQLIDVRQPKEYAEHHIPGALLMPLREVNARIHELDPGMETIVYCRSGVRSHSACQQLKGLSFEKVFNLTGGILQWSGQTAVGPIEAGLDFFLSGSYGNGAEMAYAMEAGLQSFYMLLAKKYVDKKAFELLTQMAKFEEGHMAKLAAEAKKSGQDLKALDPSSVLEGGFSQEQLLSTFGNHLETAENVIQLAMMFEAQAFDLYSRLARQSTDDELGSFYHKMAGEEKKHLEKLSAELELIL